MEAKRLREQFVRSWQIDQAEITYPDSCLGLGLKSAFVMVSSVLLTVAIAPKSLSQGKSSDTPVNSSAQVTPKVSESTVVKVGWLEATKPNANASQKSWASLFQSSPQELELKHLALEQFSAESSSSESAAESLTFNQSLIAEQSSQTVSPEQGQLIPAADCQLILCKILAQNPGPVDPRPDPNQDRLIPTPPPRPAPPEDSPDLEREIPEPTQPDLDSGVPIPIEQVDVVGSSILGPEEIDALVSPLEGRSVTLRELQEVADQITEIYLDQGFITSRAIIPEQTVENGVVQIRVIEGSLERIDVEGTQRVNQNYIRDRIMLGADQPLSTAKLEDQLRLLRINPLFDNVEASIRAGTEEGKSILIVRVTEADAFRIGFNIDNYSPPSIGSERIGISLRHLNLTGNGDIFFLSYNTTRLISDGESDVIDFFYSIPVNPMNGTIQIRIPPYRNRIIEDTFDPLNIEGKSQRYELSFRQPLIRTPREEFALSAGFAYQQSQTFLDEEGFSFGSGPDSDGTTRTSVFKFGQDYLRRDRDGAWFLQSQFSLGTGLFGGTNNAQDPNAQFFSWLGQVQRVQRLGDDHLLILQGDLQLSADPLFPSQQFVIGGALSLRGYRQNVRAGDNGFRVSIEDRITLLRDDEDQPKLQLAPIVDLGAVWNHEDNPNQIFGQSFLAGVGLGLLWEPIEGMNIRVDYGYPIVDLDDRGDNIQDDGLYFSINYGF
ncbi:MAG: ShlB/FhaC/HecB family hemolysin secretion/activation protein [Microcoleaceae cyanobacterium]